MTKDECIRQLNMAIDARHRARLHAAMIDGFWSELIGTYAELACNYTYPAPAENAPREIPFFLRKQAI